MADDNPNDRPARKPVPDDQRPEEPGIPLNVSPSTSEKRPVRTPEEQEALKRFRVNNFDLLRLAAAMQVVIYHSSIWMDIGNPESSWLLSLIHRIPGVPIFFFVSGFLISRSYETNSKLSDYSRNRAFRIFPALWACFVVSLLMVYFSGYFSTVAVPLTTFVAWSVTQLSFLQFYTPTFMDGFGNGVLNGSLWTISVELQFYVITPLLYLSLRSLSKAAFDGVLVVLIVIFAAFNVFYHHVVPGFNLLETEGMTMKLGYVSFAPWVYMFFIGILAQRNFEPLRNLSVGIAKVPLFIILYILVSYLTIDVFSFGEAGQKLDPISYIALCFCIMSIAYTLPDIANLILRRNDISYGLYIYHMPVVNLFIYLGYTGRISHQLMAIGCSLVLASLSWFLIERPVMKLKRHALNPLKAMRAAQR